MLADVPVSVRPFVRYCAYIEKAESIITQSKPHGRHGNLRHSVSLDFAMKWLGRD